MSSRLLDNLNEQLSQAHELVAWGRVQAQRALYFARQGQRETATELVAAVRHEFAAAPHAEVTAWISLAEALNKFYAKPGAEGMDRLRRAQALARAIQHPVLVPLCAAWLAHFEFNANRMEAMVLHASQALSLAQGDHHAALARVSLVLADAFHYAGRFDLAKPRYARVREHALADGDDAMISAMLHNVAAFRASAVRLEDAFGRHSPSEAKRALMEAESTRTYDYGVGSSAMRLLVPLLRAQLFTVQKDYSSAIALFDANIELAVEQGLARLLACFHADRAWCHFNQQNLQLTRFDIDAAIGALIHVADPDDSAGTHARIARVLSANGNTDASKEHEALAARYLNEHKGNQASLLALLETLNPNPR